MRITIIATGFDRVKAAEAAEQALSRNNAIKAEEPATVEYVPSFAAAPAPAPAPAPSISLSVSEPEEFVPYTPVSAPAKEQPVKVVPEPASAKNTALNGMFENYDDVIEFIKRKR